MSELVDKPATRRAGRGYFGTRLCQLREVHALAPHQMVELLQRAGYGLDGAHYAALEEGAGFPDSSARFLGAFASCLQLSADDRQDLADRLAYDILFASLGERADALLPPRATWRAS